MAADVELTDPEGPFTLVLEVRAPGWGRRRDHDKVLAAVKRALRYQILDAEVRPLYVRSHAS